jgi:hypothetical protein
MHIYVRKSTNKGFGVGGRKTVGGGLRMNRTMRLPTKGLGLSEEYYEEVNKSENRGKANNPEFIKKFNNIKIKNSKPKKYITF